MPIVNDRNSVPTYIEDDRRSLNLPDQPKIYDGASGLDSLAKSLRNFSFGEGLQNGRQKKIVEPYQEHLLNIERKGRELLSDPSGTSIGVVSKTIYKDFEKIRDSLSDPKTKENFINDFRRIANNLYTQEQAQVQNSKKKTKIEYKARVTNDFKKTLTDVIQPELNFLKKNLDEKVLRDGKYVNQMEYGLGEFQKIVDEYPESSSAFLQDKIDELFPGITPRLASLILKETKLGGTSGQTLLDELRDAQVAGVVNFFRSGPKNFTNPNTGEVVSFSTPTAASDYGYKYLEKLEIPREKKREAQQDLIQAVQNIETIAATEERIEQRIEKKRGEQLKIDLYKQLAEVNSPEFKASYKVLDNLLDSISENLDDYSPETFEDIQRVVGIVLGPKILNLALESPGSARRLFTKFQSRFPLADKFTVPILRTINENYTKKKKEQQLGPGGSLLSNKANSFTSAGIRYDVGKTEVYRQKFNLEMDDYGLKNNLNPDEVERLKTELFPLMIKNAQNEVGLINFWKKPGVAKSVQDVYADLYDGQKLENLNVSDLRALNDFKEKIIKAQSVEKNKSKLKALSYANNFARKYEVLHIDLNLIKEDVYKVLKNRGKTNANKAR